jgi:hypothetical protein
MRPDRRIGLVELELSGTSVDLHAPNLPGLPVVGFFDIDEPIPLRQSPSLICAFQTSMFARATLDSQQDIADPSRSAYPARYAIPFQLACIGRLIKRMLNHPLIGVQTMASEPIQEGSTGKSVHARALTIRPSAVWRPCI